MRRLIILAVLVGAGLPAVAHSVTLTCIDSTPGVRYNFYRGTQPGQESATPLNTAPVAACAYVDQTVKRHKTYYYVARAVCVACGTGVSGTSAPSNEIAAKIPGHRWIG
jgi:hypothetical protein